jgi:hypothetical protein
MPRLPSFTQMELPPSPQRRPRRRGFPRLVLAFLFLAVLIASGILSWLFLFPHKSPLTPYTHVIPADTVLVVNLDLAAQEKTALLREETTALQQALRGSLKELHLEPSTARPASLFTAVTRKGEVLRLWQFSEPVNLDKSSRGRYEESKKSGTRFLQDRFEPTICWCVDEKGRLLSGPGPLLEGARTRTRTNKKTPAFDDLDRWITDVPSNALLWGVVDFGRLPLKELPLPPEQSAALANSRANGVFFSLSPAEKYGLSLQAQVFCPNKTDAQVCRAVLDNLKPQMAAALEPRLPDDQAKQAARALAASPFQEEDAKLFVSLALPLSLARLGLQAQTDDLLQAQKEVKKKADKAYLEEMDKGAKAFAKEQFPEAEAALGLASDLYPASTKAREKLAVVRAAWERKKRFDQYLASFDQSSDAAEQFNAAADQGLHGKGLDLAREKIAPAKERLAQVKDKLDQAKEKLTQAREKLKQAGELRPLDPVLAARSKKWQALDKKRQELSVEQSFQQQFREANVALADQELEQAEKLFQAARLLRPKDGGVQGTLGTLKKLQAVKARLAEAQKAQAKKDREATAQALKKAANDIWEELKKSDERFSPVVKELAGDTTQAYLSLIQSSRASIREVKWQGQRAVLEGKYPAAIRRFTEVLEELKTTRRFVTDAASLANLPELERDKQQLAAESAAVDRERKASQGQLYLQEARKLVNAGHADEVARWQGGQKLFEAQIKYRQALAKLQEAAKCPGTEKDPLFEQTRKALDEVARLIQPLDLKLKTGKLPADWDFDKKSWKVHTLGSQTWLQVAQTQKSGSLESPEVEFPTDFELALDFGLLDREGAPNNYRWKTCEDLLTVLLIARESSSPNLVIRLGKDPASTKPWYYDVPVLKIGDQGYEVGRLGRSKHRVIAFRLLRQKGNLRVLLDGEEVAALPVEKYFKKAAPGDFKQLFIQVKNGFGSVPHDGKLFREMVAYPVLYRVSLTLYQQQAKRGKVRARK